MIHTRKRTNKLLLVSLVLVAVILITLLLVWLYQRRTPTFDPIPVGDPLAQSTAFSILSSEEQDGKIVVTTNRGTLRYPAEYADTLFVEAGMDKDIPTLRFSITVDIGKTILFSICYGGNQGIPCGTYRASADEEEIPVFVIFADVPDQLDSEDQIAFEAAQELFNDIVRSMEEDARFKGLQ